MMGEHVTFNKSPVQKVNSQPAIRLWRYLAFLVHEGYACRHFKSYLHSSKNPKIRSRHRTHKLYLLYKEQMSTSGGN